MEGEAGVATKGSLPMPSSAGKKWRAVSEHHHHSVRNASDEGTQRWKLGQSDERTIYEHGREPAPAHVDFCSITTEGGVGNDILQQQLNHVVRKREELQQMEIELRAQTIVQSELMEIQRNFDARMKEHANAAAQLQEHLHEREQSIHDLERKFDEKDRALNAIKLEKEAAWAKEDLLIEQNKELANFRRERDHSDAERVQHIKQIHDLQEHIQKKDRQLNELQDQYRTAQEAILYKDEQFREAQTWITRVQEMDVFQSSSTNHSLQAELRERTEQYSQLWVACQRQFSDMERLHLLTIQQLQLELADARERNSTYTDESRTSIMKSKDGSPFGQDSGNQVDANGAVAMNANAGVLPNGADNVQPFTPSSNASVQNNFAPGIPNSPSSILGMHTFVPPGQATAIHPFMMHHQGVPQSMSSHISQSHSGHFHMASMSPVQQWQSQKQTVGADGSQLSAHIQFSASQNVQGLVRPDGKYEHEIHVNGRAIGPQYRNQVSQGPEVSSNASSTEKPQALESVDSSYLADVQPEQSMQHTSSQSEENFRNFGQEHAYGQEGQVLTEQASSASTVSQLDTSEHTSNAGETAINNGTGSLVPEALVSAESDTVMGRKASVIALLDEGSLLACIARTIPAGGRIRISSTLPNRLGKMLSPFHWHDYKKKYGKLDDFVASHPDLFVTEGDYIQLQEGAQKMIAATAAAAKVAAAASAAAPTSNFLPSVAVTPMAQSHRQRKLPSTNLADVSQPSVIQNQLPNGAHFSVARGVSNVKLLSKPKDSELSGANFDRSSTSNIESRGSTHGRSNAGYLGKQPSRTSGSTVTSIR